MVCSRFSGPAKDSEDKIKAKVIDLAWSEKLLFVSTGNKFDSDNANWGLLAYTMIGKPRLDNLQFCIEEVIKNNTPGDLIETGVWRAGATIFMRATFYAADIMRTNTADMMSQFFVYDR